MSAPVSPPDCCACQAVLRRQLLACVGAALLLAAYMLLGVFFGMDLCDCGFYLTFYDNFFSAPATVEFNFMYYLTGLLGGALQWIFPDIGIAGMRLAGVASCLAVMALLYAMLRRLLPTPAIIAGWALVVVSFIHPPLTLSYDLFTALFYVAAIAAMYVGMVRNRLGWLALSGVLAALNVFNRIPNVLGLGMVLIPFIHNAYAHVGVRQALRQAVAFTIGVAVGVSAMFALMAALGHLTLFGNVINDLRTIADDHSGTTSHTTGQMLAVQLRFYGLALWTAVKLGFLVATYPIACRMGAPRAVCYGVLAAALAVAAWMMWRMPALLPLWLICVAGGGYTLWRGNNRLRLAALLGLGMLLVMPLGSDGGPLNNGSIIAWVAAPVAVVPWLTRRRVPFVLLFLLVCGARAVVQGAYFDDGLLTAKTAVATASPRAAHVYTTPERATIVNRLLTGIAPFVHRGDTLFAYGSLPTINYLTATRPYIGCSWPEQLSTRMLADKLAAAEQCQPLPWVLRQKFNTIGNHWGPPSDNYLMHYDVESVYQNDGKLVVVNTFLRRNGYRCVYNDSHFVLYAPPAACP